MIIAFTIIAILPVAALVAAFIPWHRCPVCGRRWHCAYWRDWHVAWHHAAAVLLLALTAAGCQKDDFVYGQPSNRYNTVTLTATAGGIDSNAAKIKDTAKDGSQQAPTLPHWAKIEGLSESIINYVTILRETAKAYSATDEQYTAEIDKRDKRIAALEKELAASKADNEASNRWVWRAGLALAALMTVAGAIVIKIGSPKTGALLMAGGIALMVVSQTMLTYGWIIAICGAAFFAFATLVLAYQVWNHRQELSRALAFNA